MFGNDKIVKMLTLNVSYDDDDNSTPDTSYYDDMIPLKINPLPPLGPERKGPTILCLDLDETLGHFGPFSIGWNTLKHFNDGKNPPISDCIKSHLNPEGRPGAIRPGVKELFQCCSQLKKQKRLEEVVIFTSASNAGGYIDFLVECLINFAGVESNTIDRIISKEHSFEIASDGATIKDLSMVVSEELYSEKAGDYSNTIIVDDKAFNIKQYEFNPETVEEGGCVISVSQYVQYVPTIDMFKTATWWDNEMYNNITKRESEYDWKYTISSDELLTHTGLALSAINNDLAEFPPNNNNYSNDNELFRVIEIIKKRY